MANKRFTFLFLFVLVLGLSISLFSSDSYALSRNFSKSKKVTAFSPRSRPLRIAKLNQKIRILNHKIGTKKYDSGCESLWSAAYYHYAEDNIEYSDQLLKWFAERGCYN